MRDYRGSLTYKDHKFMLVFNLNVMEIIQEKFGTIEKWGSLTDGAEPDAAALKFGVWAMLNEGIDIENEETGSDLKPFTLKQVGRLLSEVGMDTASDALHETVTESVKSDEKNA